MKRTIRKLTALVLVLTLVLSMSALATVQTPSKGFKLPTVKARPTAVPEAETSEAETTLVPAEPEATVAPGETPIPEATAAPEEVEAEETLTVIATAYVTLEDVGSSLNVRAAATTDSARIGSLHHGDSVSVLGYEGDWTKILYGGAVAYVKSSYLSSTPAAEPTEEPAEEPTVESTEEPTVEPTEEPVEEPTVEPTEEPAEEPTVEPTEEPTVEPTEELVVEPTVEPTEEPTAEPTEEPAAEPDLTGLRQIILVLDEGETSLKLYAEADADSAVLATIAAGEILYVQNIEAEWSYAVYGDLAGYVRTEKIALFNEAATPEEEEIIRTVTVSSNVAEDEFVYAGTEIVLSARLTGFDDVQYALQWQYTPDGGATIVDVPGANDMQYAFTIDDSNAHYLWRVSVTIVAGAAE